MSFFFAQLVKGKYSPGVLLWKLLEEASLYVSSIPCICKKRCVCVEIRFSPTIKLCMHAHMCDEVYVYASFVYRKYWRECAEHTCACARRECRESTERTSDKPSKQEILHSTINKSLSKNISILGEVDILGASTKRVHTRMPAHTTHNANALMKLGLNIYLELYFSPTSIIIYYTLPSFLKFPSMSKMNRRFLQEFHHVFGNIQQLYNIKSLIKLGTN